MPISKRIRNRIAPFASFPLRPSDPQNLCHTAIPKCHTGQGKELYAHLALLSSGRGREAYALTREPMLPSLHPMGNSLLTSSAYLQSQTSLRLHIQSPVPPAR